MHEERDALRLKVEMQDGKVNVLQKELDELRREIIQKSPSYKEGQLRQLELELAELKIKCAEQAEELALLRKQTQGAAEFKDFNAFIASSKKRHEDASQRLRTYADGL